MQVGESVAFVIQMQEEDKCVFCGGTHEEPKKEEVKETAPGDSGWKRVSMKDAFEKIPKKLAIYPNDTFPPDYKYQGHHCMALSAFVKKPGKSSRKDKRLRLNHFLKKVGFYPNRDKNSIGLPARRSYGDFEAFWESFDANKPVQLHGPGHDERYFIQVNTLINRMVSMITAPGFCEELTKSEWEGALKQAIESAENYAFNRLARNEFSWRLHHIEQQTAIRIYTSPVDQVFQTRGAKKKQITLNGQGNIDAKISFPDPKLDEGPFA